MNFRKISENQRKQYNSVVSHPLQSWEWGEFRDKTGVEIVRRGLFDNGELIDGFQLTIHKIPYTPWTVGYFPKGKVPDKEILRELTKIGKKYNCIFIKLEPNVTADTKYKILNTRYKIRKSPHPLFTKYTFQIDLTKSEDELLGQMKSKTRYNVRLAHRKGVKVVEDNSEEAFAEYIKLLRETIRRQGFYAHSEDYHRKMWEVLYPAGIAHLLKAVYRGKTLVIWIVLLFNSVLYYPYGASSSAHREAMASNRIMWEAMLWGKKQGAKIFDMWGSLGPDPDKNDPWYGFHRFKEGYGGDLVEFVGTYDLVFNPLLYRLYNMSHNIRWKILKFLKGPK